MRFIVLVLCLVSHLYSAQGVEIDYYSYGSFIANWENAPAEVVETKNILEEQYRETDERIMILNLSANFILSNMFIDISQNKSHYTKVFIKNDSYYRKYNQRCDSQNTYDLIQNPVSSLTYQQYLKELNKNHKSTPIETRILLALLLDEKEFTSLSKTFPQETLRVLRYNYNNINQLCPDNIRNEEHQVITIAGLIAKSHHLSSVIRSLSYYGPNYEELLGKEALEYIQQFETYFVNNTTTREQILQSLGDLVLFDITNIIQVLKYMGNFDLAFELVLRYQDKIRTHSSRRDINDLIYTVFSSYYRDQLIALFWDMLQHCSLDEHTYHYEVACRLKRELGDESSWLGADLKQVNYTLEELHSLNCPDINDRPNIRVYKSFKNNTANSLLIGVPVNDGAFSDWALYAIDDLNGGRTIRTFPIRDDMTLKEIDAIAPYIDGIIGPGNGDRYPKTNQPFGIDEASIYPAYQVAYNMARDYHIPYLGLCYGAQTQYLMEGGKLHRFTITEDSEEYQLLKKLSDYFYSTYGADDEQHLHMSAEDVRQKLKPYFKANDIKEDSKLARFIYAYIEDTKAPIVIKAGSMTHWMMLNDPEQREFLATCSYPEIVITSPYRAHSYTGHSEYPGESLDMAGELDNHNMQAYSAHGIHFSSQFHPDYAVPQYNKTLNSERVLSDEQFSDFNRQANYLMNFINLCEQRRSLIRGGFPAQQLEDRQMQISEHIKSCIQE